jgi:hypothetical protein
LGMDQSFCYVLALMYRPLRCYCHGPSAKEHLR